MTEQFVKDFNKHIDALIKEADELDRLGLAFYTTGNTIVSDKLQSLSDNIRITASEISVSFDETLIAGHKEAQAAVGGTLKAMLNAANLGDAFVLQLEEVECSSIKLEKVLRNITGNWKRKDQMPDVVKEPFAVARFIFQPEDLHTAIVGTRELFIANNIDGTAVPEDVYSLRFAEWVCAQQELAFIAGCNMTKQLMEQDAAMAEYEKETEAQFQTLLNKQSVNQMILNEGLRAFEKDTSDEVYGNDSDVSGTT